MTLEITEEWDGETLWKQEDLVAFAPELATAAEMDCGEDCDCEDCSDEKKMDKVILSEEKSQVWVCPHCKDKIKEKSLSGWDKENRASQHTCGGWVIHPELSDAEKQFINDLESKSEVEIEIEVKPEGECECESPEPQESEGKKSCAKCGKKMKADISNKELVASVKAVGEQASKTSDSIQNLANIINDLKEFEKSLKNPNSRIFSCFVEIDGNMAVSTQNLTKALKSSATVMELTVMNSENTNNTAMITSFADINEEFLKTAQANELREFLEKQVAESASKASEQLKSEKAAVENEKAALANELETLKKQLADKESQLSALIAEKSQATAQELFSKRMAYFDDKFDLTTEDKQVIAKVLKEVKNDEAFAAYQKDMDILLKGKVKGAKEAVASTVVVNEDKIVKAALDNADPEKVTVTAGSVKEEPKTFIEKYAKYFALNQENFTKR